jgi:hypothetical protein
MIEKQIQLKLAVQIAVAAGVGRLPVLLITGRMPQFHEIHAPEVARGLPPADPRKTGEDVPVAVDQQGIVSCAAANG